MKVKRDWLEKLMFGGAASRRFTQDSPILPDVWIEFAGVLATDRSKRVDLLFSPHRDASASALAHAIRIRLKADKTSRSWKQWHKDAPSAPRIAYHNSSAVADLTFHELLRVVLPLSPWWVDTVKEIPGEADLVSYLEGPAVRATVMEQLRRLENDPEQPVIMRGSKAHQSDNAAKTRKQAPESLKIPIDLLWMIRVIGTLLLASRAKEPKGDDGKPFFALSFKYGDHIDEFTTLFAGAPKTEFDAPLLYTVSRNRQAAPSIARSVMAVKADAVRRLFEVDTRNLAWAVVDSGIDAKHPAFRKRDPATQMPYKDAFTEKGGRWINNTTIIATFDFSRIRRVLDPDASDQQRHDAAPAATRKGATKKLGASAVRLAGDASPPTLDRRTLADRAGDVSRRLERGGAIDWSELIPLFTVPNEEDNYVTPAVDHGTHVAGILGGDWQKKHWPGTYPADQPLDLVGVCPGLTIYDLRVLNEKGEGDEFTVMAALQFIRYLNSHRDQSVIHGANLSLSLRHDVANYACGRTPVCDECERVVASGVVVVAAAGNDGYMRFATPSGESEGYRSISISDPGNANAVITVGATHRYAAHTYGVSYFSSRGPTGDGRIKPDLVAPGEKITAPVLNGDAGTKDGTSMAAPHVSGAAVLLMARHRELVGNTAKIKQILCSTATDLGREHYFQGSGMVDILRALQAV